MRALWVHEPSARPPPSPSATHSLSCLRPVPAHEELIPRQ